MMKPERVPARWRVVRQGDRPDRIHVLLSGFACRYRLLPEGQRQILGFILPGDACNLQFFGALDYSVAALTSCDVATVSRRELEQLAQERPGIASALWCTAMADQSALREWLVSVGARSAVVRLAHMFCEFHTRLMQLGLVNGTSFNLPITQVDVANALGLSSVHANRSLMQLRTRGLMEWKAGRVTIPDPGALQRFGSFNPYYLHMRTFSCPWPVEHGPGESAAAA
ncbi:Crp/Fnr family transcriptional regulator [Roseomonas sp. SSH11]|uniref:Crp/Fnr family transcriptional regulator n=1 Tax=Pararoseomonas baculiformis TaxID=2820812 RepID=A0ABS4ADP2_9PROT|nr:Crp/Fnr family transcriptional regulator [Pararoseomonas baculiformis]MBP0445131.1 Crp/Fnr family transcriptional regulator [Pararoseomonas baculiformis]